MDVTHKEGKSGELVFVAVQHEYFSDNGLVIRERQDLVYREIKPVSKPTPAVVKSRPIDTRCDKQWCINASTPLLFRYSALTFNGHRIHYDLPYAQNEEFYEGLVVQGPLQASFLFNLAAEVLGQAPSHFSYRGVNPLIAGQDFWVQARVISSGVIECWVSDFQGDTTMKASASINTGVGE
jgi:3-methylfumaryl-CoA hydratase